MMDKYIDSAGLRTFASLLKAKMDSMQKHVFLTESEYDTLEAKDADTLYFITEE